MGVRKWAVAMQLMQDLCRNGLGLSFPSCVVSVHALERAGCWTAILGVLRKLSTCAVGLLRDELDEGRSDVICSERLGLGFVGADLLRSRCALGQAAERARQRCLYAHIIERLGHL